MLEGGEAAALYIRIACDWKMFLNRQGLEKIFSQVFMAKKICCRLNYRNKAIMEMTRIDT